MTEKELLALQYKLETMDEMDLYAYARENFPDMLPNGKKKILIRRILNTIREQMNAEDVPASE